MGTLAGWGCGLCVTTASLWRAEVTRAGSLLSLALISTGKKTEKWVNTCNVDSGQDDVRCQSGCCCCRSVMADMKAT